MKIRRLTDDQLFRPAPASEGGIASIGDATLDRLLDAAELNALRRLDSGYRSAIDEELLKQPENIP